MSGLASYGAVQLRLADIDDAIAERQEPFETAARDYFTAKRDFERDFAIQHLKETGTVDERRHKTIVALWQTESYKALVSAEANYEALKGVLRTFETRASIGQSLLKAMQREVGG